MNNDREWLAKKIASDILDKLAFTNGWRIDEAGYEKLCDELSADIIHTIEQQDKCVSVDRDSILDEAIEAIKAFKRGSKHAVAIHQDAGMDRAIKAIEALKND